MYTYNDNIWDYEFSSTSKTLMLIQALLMIVVWWRLFEKAGQAGWKSIIPIYNVWTVCKIANSFGSAIGWFIGSIIPGINIIVLAILRWKFASRYTNSTGLRLLYFFFPFIGGLILAFGDDYTYKPEGLNTYYR